MAPPIAEDAGTAPNGVVNGTNGLHKVKKNFDDITITGFYSRDIRFPVGCTGSTRVHPLTSARHLFKMKAQTP